MNPRISATDAARQFSDLLNRVKYQGQSFEITRGNEAVARIVPTSLCGVVHVADLGTLFSALPHLDSADADDFAGDLNAIRSSASVDGVSDWD